jgi:hypothetical protein
MSAERFPYLHTVPAIALQNALKKADLDVHDLACSRSTRRSRPSRCT